MEGNSKYDPTRPATERFWARVDRRPRGSGCWLWRGTRNHGQGCLNVEGRSVSSRRFAWWVRHGAWPTLPVRLRCGNSMCVNPDHLYLENTQKVSK